MFKLLILILALSLSAQWTQTSTDSTYGFTKIGKTIFAGTTTGISKSLDEGKTWSPISMSNGATVLTSIGTNLIANKRNTNGAVKSTNNGTSWTNISTLSNCRINVFTNNGLTLFAGTDSGIYRSTDNGSTWTNTYSNGMPKSSNIYDMTINSNGTIFACAQWGILKSTNGLNWTWINPGGLNFSQVFSRALVSLGSIVYFNWTTANTSGTELKKGTWKTTNEGTTWTASNTGFTDLKSTERGLTQSNLSLFAATLNNYLFFSKDSGNHWKNIGFNKLIQSTIFLDSDIIISATDGIWKKSMKPDTIKLTTQLNNTIDQPNTLTLTWNSATLTDAFRIQFATNPNFEFPAIDQSITDTTFTANLQYNTSYYYKITSINSWGTTDLKGNFTTLSTPTIPTPTFPISETNLPISTTLKWTSTDNSTHDLQLSTNTQFTTPLYDLSNLTEDSQNITLNYNTTYYWKIKSTNTLGTSEWSTISTFTTIPDAPSLFSPTTNSIFQGTSLALTWQNISATSYTIQISTDSTFTSTLDSTSLVTSKTINNLIPATTYYWRINGNFNGTIGPWSTIYQFTTLITIPEIPILSTSNNLINQPLSLQLYWNSSTRAETYSIQIATDSTFSTIFKSDSNLTLLSYTISNLSNYSTYYWQIKANNIGGSSNWSTFNNFTTIISAPETPALISPTSNTISQPLTLQLTWNSSTRAESYSLLVASDSNFQFNRINDSTTSLTSTISNLSNTTKYYWKVKANNIGGSSNWSTSYTFTTIPASSEIPTLVSPLDNSQNQPTSITVNWNNTLNALSYTLQLSTTPTFDSLYTNISQIDTFYQISNLSNNTKYFWRLATTTIGGITPWSTSSSFSTIISLPSTIILKTPINDTLTSSTITLEWFKGDTSITNYLLEYSTDSSFTTSTLDTLTDTSKTLYTLTNKTVYYWRIMANNSTGWNTFSSKGRVYINKPTTGTESITTKTYSLSSPTGSGLITYSLPTTEKVTIRISSINGQIISNKNFTQNTGIYSFKISNQPAGFYILSFRAGNYSLIKKIVILN